MAQLGTLFRRFGCYYFVDGLVGQALVMFKVIKSRSTKTHEEYFEAEETITLSYEYFLRNI